MISISPVPLHFSDRMLALKTSKPHLPFELERYIFELAAQDEKSAARVLCLVTRRAQAWIQPLLYRRIVLTSSFDSSQDTASQFLRTLASKPPRFFARHVKSLFIMEPLSAPQISLEPILLVCGGIQEFGYSSPFRAPQLIPYLNCLPSLTRLSVSTHTFTSLDCSTPENIWTLPFFRSIRCLELTYLSSSSHLPSSQNLPNLECLSVNDVLDADVILDCLEQNPSLKTFAFVNIEDGFDSAALCKIVQAVTDPRFVLYQGPKWWEQTWGHAGPSDEWNSVLSIAERQRKAAELSESV